MLTGAAAAAAAETTAAAAESTAATPAQRRGPAPGPPAPHAATRPFPVIARSSSQDVLPEVAAIAEEAPEDVLEAAEAKDDPIARFVLARILSQTAAHSHLQWDTLVEGEVAPAAHAAHDAHATYAAQSYAAHAAPAARASRSRFRSAVGAACGAPRALAPHRPAPGGRPAVACGCGHMVSRAGLQILLEKSGVRPATRNALLPPPPQARRCKTAQSCTASPASSCARWRS